MSVIVETCVACKSTALIVKTVKGYAVSPCKCVKEATK
jgi:hypothetical protein